MTIHQLRSSPPDFLTFSEEEYQRASQYLQQFHCSGSLEVILEDEEKICSSAMFDQKKKHFRKKVEASTCLVALAESREVVNKEKNDTLHCLDSSGSWGFFADLPDTLPMSRSNNGMAYPHRGIPRYHQRLCLHRKMS